MARRGFKTLIRSSDNLRFKYTVRNLSIGGLRVPAFITGKGVKQGQYSNIMHITDIQMTILDMIGHKRTGTKAAVV